MQLRSRGAELCATRTHFSRTPRYRGNAGADFSRAGRHFRRARPYFRWRGRYFPRARSHFPLPGWVLPTSEIPFPLAGRELPTSGKALSLRTRVFSPAGTDSFWRAGSFNGGSPFRCDGLSIVPPHPKAQLAGLGIQCVYRRPGREEDALFRHSDAAHVGGLAMHRDIP